MRSEIREAGPDERPPWLHAVTALVLAGLALLGFAAVAEATCLPMARAPDGLHPAVPSARGPVPAALGTGTVELTFLGHASFLIRTPEGAAAVTDFNDYIGAPVTPDIVTMNNAHDTHYTDRVPASVRHVLRGWGDADGPARHAVRERDLFVRNVPTNVREYGGTRHAGNSIFVFEVEDLCIAHLGHLHHTLTPEHLVALGSIDVLLTPVDGSYTLAQSLMREVVEAIRPSLIVPMHYFGSSTLARFLDGLREDYEIRTSDTPTVTLSRATLPRRQVLVLPGR